MIAARQLFVVVLALFCNDSKFGIVQARVQHDSKGTGADANNKYTSHDDVSWAVTRPDHLASPYHQKLYDDFMKGCNDASSGACQAGEEFRLKMNRLQPGGVLNFTETGFTKIRAPPALMESLQSFWKANKDKTAIEWKQINSYHNMWAEPVYFVSLEDAALGGGKDFQRDVWRGVRPLLEEWTGMALSPVTMYGIREYRNNSILAPHVDRFPLVTSCIINVAQDVDEDWPLEVFDHDGNAHNVTMEPGDMVLYESHSVIHGRPFPLKGRSFVNVFLHFQPIGPLGDVEEWGPHGDDEDLPPYVIPGGQWEPEYRKAAPKPWSVPQVVPTAISRGDLRGLEYVAFHKPEDLTKLDYNGWRPVHEAAYRGDLDSLEFLLDNGATIYDRIGKEGDTPGPNVLEIAQQSPEVDMEHPVMLFLLDEMASSEL